MSPEDLVKSAMRARSASYSPYSSYAVGAAVLTTSGEVIEGCNVENASYGLTICAERVALSRAVAMGHRRFQALAVVTQDGGSMCGACRQFLREFGPDCQVYLADASGQFRSQKLSQLLPESFGPDSLKNSN